MICAQVPRIQSPAPGGGEPVQERFANDAAKQKGRPANRVACGDEERGRLRRGFDSNSVAAPIKCDGLAALRHRNWLPIRHGFADQISHATKLLERLCGSPLKRRRIIERQISPRERTGPDSWA
jgi:hypothetical protein